MGARYHSVSSALHTGSVLFETGAKQRWRTDGQTSSDRGFLANTTVGRVFSATAGGFATAANGEHVMYGGGNQDENDTSYNQERRDLDRAKEQANTQVRTTIETYSDAKTKAESIQKLYRKGEATLDQVTVANQNLAKAHENAVKAKDIRDAQESDVKRDKAAGKEYKQGLRKLEKNPKSVGKSEIDSTLEEPGGG